MEVFENTKGATKQIPLFNIGDLPKVRPTDPVAKQKKKRESDFFRNKRYRIHYQLRKKGFKVNSLSRIIEAKEEMLGNSFLKRHLEFLKIKYYTIQVTTGL